MGILELTRFAANGKVLWLYMFFFLKILKWFTLNRYEGISYDQLNNVTKLNKCTNTIFSVKQQKNIFVS